MMLFSKRNLLALPLSLIILLLSACGTQTPSSFVHLTKERVEYISWQNNNGTLSGNGTFTTWSTFSGPSSSSYAFTGKMDNNHVSIGIGGLTMLVGDIKDDTLQTATNDSEGHSIQDKWYAMEKEDYNKLVTAFSAYSQTDDFATKLQGDLDSLPTDSDSADAVSYGDYEKKSVGSADENLDYAQKQLEEGGNYGCFDLTNPAISEDQFILPSRVLPSFATLEQDKQNVKTQWEKTSKLSLPSLHILLPWKSNTAAIQKLLKSAQDREISIETQITGCAQNWGSRKTRGPSCDRIGVSTTVHQKEEPHADTSITHD